jgi:transketolase
MNSETKKIATRDAFGEEIVLLGRENKNIYVVDVDIGKSCKTTNFAKTFPEQHVNVGIAEQSGAGVAAGLASCEKIPFVVTYAVFGSLRMCEMIRQEICYPNLNVKIACSHGGLTPANDGASHQCVEDMGVLRTIPNMTVIMPADYHAARKLTRAAAEKYGPCYLRFTRDAIPVIYDESAHFEIGKANILKEGADAAIIANGDTVCLALEASRLLSAKGIESRVLDMHTVKPLDEEAVRACVNEIGRIITVEDHNILNGLGSAVSDIAAGMGKGIVRRIGVQDQFGQSAPYERLLEMNGITPMNIAKTAESMLASVSPGSLE